MSLFAGFSAVVRPHLAGGFLFLEVCLLLTLIFTGGFTVFLFAFIVLFTVQCFHRKT